MNYPCGIIRDLLPLYIDNIGGEESRNAIEQHLEECENCREHYEQMKASGGIMEHKKDNVKDMNIANSLKAIKKKLDKKIKRTIAGSVIAAAVIFLLFQALFNMPLKELDIDDVFVSAEVYKLRELPKADSNSINTNETVIYVGENDTSEIITLEMPDIGKLKLTQAIMDKYEYVSLVSWSSPYFLRSIEFDTERSDEKNIYISSFKTTFLNNKAQDYNSYITSMEFSKIEKIVYVEKNGTEYIMWENK